MASKRRLRRKACGNKVKHATHDEAILVAHKTARKYKQRLSAYKCKYCGSYHVGHTPKEVKQFTRNPITLV